MSDIPPPPPPPGATPPPPPPNLTPPPGYSAYAPSYMSSVSLKRVRGLTTWIVVLTAVIGVVGVLSALLSRLATDEARDFLADESQFLEDEFLEAYTPSLLLGFVQSAATVAVIVLTMIWMYRLAANHRTLQRAGTWAPGWAIGGWFLPPLILYLIPFLMFRELWKASDPNVPAGDQRWKQNRVGLVVVVWWVLYGLAPIPIAIAQGISDIGARTFSGDTELLAEAVDEGFTISLISSLVAAAAAAAYIVMARQLSSRHRRLTGEAAHPT